MNSATLAGSLIFAVTMVLLIAALIRLMMRGWRRRAQRQAELIGGLPDPADEIGTATTTLRGMYVGCTFSPVWNDRVAVGDLGYRSKAVLMRYPEGIMLERSGADPIWIPQESIIAVRTERGIAGKVVARNAILVIRWRLPSGTEIDTGFRANNRDEYAEWLEEAA